MEAGVPQGAVLSPFLYNIYVSDPPRTQRTSLALYADDTAIMARSRSGRLLTRYLQEETTALEKWCNKWKIDLNAEKMQTIVFKRRPKMIEGNVRLQGMDIEWRNEATYLGVKMDQKLTWEAT